MNRTGAGSWSGRCESEGKAGFRFGVRAWSEGVNESGAIFEDCIQFAGMDVFCGSRRLVLRFMRSAQRSTL